MNKRILHILLAIGLLTNMTSIANAQVTIGSGLTPNKATLLDIKTQQETGVVSSISDDKNITSETGGLLLPRVKLLSISNLEPFIAVDDSEFVNNTNSMKEKLAGLMVYNITNNGVGSTLYPAVYTWNGAIWTTSQANEATSSIVSEPKAFTFYETGLEVADPLTFIVDGLGTWTYQWYQITGGNIHTRVGEPIGAGGTITGTGSTTASFTPTGIIKGATRNANNTGFYKFYCTAKSSLGAKLESEIAEVAVGCGAKNNLGEWITFMCFNLGADNNSTISSQINYPIGAFTNVPSSNLHTYILNEENLWGDLFQWGRIVDGHEDRQSAHTAFNSIAISDVASGNRCTTSDNARPYLQVAKTSSAYQNFITSTVNWTPVTQTAADQIWRTGRFVQNDPCAHYKTDGSYQEFWHEGTDTQSNSLACTDAGTAWRIPSQNEWGEIYKGGTLSGSFGVATANTWVWNGTNGRGFEIRPDGLITTLFLPAAGYRRNSDGSLYHQGNYGDYWTTSILGISNAYHLFFSSQRVGPANSNSRSYGMTLRCIKNS